MRDGRVRAEVEFLGGRYRLDKELGRGAHTVSWLATELKTARPCVIKRLREADAPPAAAVLLAKQAAILAKLDHPALPAFVEYLVEGEGAEREHRLVTRFHPGESLECLVAKGRLLSEAQALGLLRRLVPVFEYLHGFDPPLVHRFLKASNIIVGPDGRPCLADFHFIADGEDQRAREEEPSGEEPLLFAAPEVAAGGAVPASDICALGLAVIYMMTGQDPAALAREGSRARLREMLKVGDSFADVLARMVDPALERRYPDARSLAADLARLAAGRVPGSPPQQAPPTPPAETEARPSRHGLVPAAIAAVALLAAGGLLWFRVSQRVDPLGDSLVSVASSPQPPRPPEGSAAPPEAPEPPPVSASPASTAETTGGGVAAPAPEAPAPIADASPAAEPPPPTALPAPTPSPPAAPAADGDPNAVVSGRLLLDGKPVADLALPAPLFWFRDEVSKREVKPRVDYAGGAFSVRDLSPGRYGMSVRVNLEPANPNLFPGDLSAWAPFTLEEGRPVTLEVPLRRVIRLLQPADTNVILKGWEVPCGGGQPLPARILFAWEPLGTGATYEVRIDRLACDRGYASVGAVFERATSDAWVNVELPPSVEGECYSFRLTASREDRPLGILTAHGKTGFGWDYRFRVAP